MTDKHILSVTKRSITGKKSHQLFKEGWALANVSAGQSGESIPLQVKSSTLQKLLNKAGESTLIYLDVEGQNKQIPCLIAEVQEHPLSGAFQHVSFREVSLKQKVTAEVPVVLNGQVEIEGGLLVSLKDAVEVEALPTDLPSSIEIDVTTLTEVGQGISLADIKLGEAVTLVLAEDQDPAETMIVMIQAEQQEEPEEETSETPDMPEVIGEAKAEEPAEEAKSEAAAE